MSHPQGYASTAETFANRISVKQRDKRTRLTLPLQRIIAQMNIEAKLVILTDPHTFPDGWVDEEKQESGKLQLRQETE